MGVAGAVEEGVTFWLVGGEGGGEGVGSEIGRGIWVRGGESGREVEAEFADCGWGRRGGALEAGKEVFALSDGEYGSKALSGPVEIPLKNSRHHRSRIHSVHSRG